MEEKKNAIKNKKGFWAAAANKYVKHLVLNAKTGGTLQTEVENQFHNEEIELFKSLAPRVLRLYSREVE